MCKYDLLMDLSDFVEDYLEEYEDIPTETSIDDFIKGYLSALNEASVEVAIGPVVHSAILYCFEGCYQ